MNKLKLIRASSELAAQEVVKKLSRATAGPQASSSTGFLDIVYISGRNDHCSVSNDIRTWWPLIKDGGIIGGAGYHFYDGPYTKCVDEKGVEQPGGVRSAVLNWATENDLQIVTLAISSDKSWWVRKPITYE